MGFNRKAAVGLLLCIVCCGISLTHATVPDWHFRGPNIALHKTAHQYPGTFNDSGAPTGGYNANLAVDGNTNTTFSGKSCTHTTGVSYLDNQHRAEWSVDLGKNYHVTGIVIYNRKVLQSRLKNFKIVGVNGDTCAQPCHIYDDSTFKKYGNPNITIEVNLKLSFSKISIYLPKQTDNALRYLTLCEVQIYAAPQPSCNVIHLENGHIDIFNGSGLVVQGKYTADTVLQASCNERSMLHGPTHINCASNGFRITCNNITIPNGYMHQIKTFYEEGETVNIKCYPGYETRKPGITCLGTGNWDIQAKCNKKQCDKPEAPINGYYVTNKSEDGISLKISHSLPIGSFIHAMCNFGYEVLTRVVRKCQNDQSWSGILPICKQKQCAYPEQITNGYYIFENSTRYLSGYSYFNTTISVICNIGYELRGSKAYVCTNNKTWDRMSTCEKIQCEFPGVPKNYFQITKVSRDTVQLYPYGKADFLDTIHVECLQGYALNASSMNRKCLDTKTWSGEIGKCVLVTCKALTKLDSGVYHYSNNTNYSNDVSPFEYSYNTTVIASCQETFHLLNTSNKIQRCTETGEWSNGQAICIKANEAATKQGAALVGGVSAASGVIIIIIVLAILFLYRRRQKAGNKTGKPKRYTGLQKRENNKGILTNTQDGVYSEIQESRLSSIIDTTSSASPRDDIYINLTEKEADKDTLKHSNQSSVSLQLDAYYSFTNVDKVPESAILVKELSDLILTGSETKRKFEKEFQNLPQGMVEAHKEAKKKKNITKNRYKNLYAYDDTRVVLKTEDSSQSDYINACYVHGFNKVRQYIASQGPTQEILPDFWRMIWQEGSTKIVMLTNLVEERVNKCEQYWPEEDTNHVYGDIKVHTEKEENFSQFVKRVFHVKKDGCKQRTITQYHFTAWPDKGVPKYSSSLVQFTNKVKYDSAVETGPIVVHCSAGVGRTGTFIALDYLTEQGKKMGYIDVFGTIKAFRSQRVSLVQTLYIFVHHALVECLMLPTSALPAYKFPEAFHELHLMDIKKKKTKLEIEFETLKKVSPVADEDEYVSSKLVRNRRKNRYSNVLPVEEFMPSLMSKQSDSENRYINAVFLSSYKERKAFIITQTPLENTIEDFWDLIWEHDVHTIVMMNNVKEVVDSEKYWPETNKSVTHGSIVITNDGMENNNHHHQLVSLTVNKHKLTRQVKQIRCGGWQHNHSLPDSPEVVLTLLELVKVWQRQSGHHTIVVHCTNGVDKSGLYCVISAVIERLQIEQDVAISQVTEEMRNAREQIIPSVEQYKFCHESVLAFIHQFDTYSNFAE